MTVATQNTTKRNGAKPDKARMVADDIVTANGLATHLGMTRQNVGVTDGERDHRTAQRRRL